MVLFGRKSELNYDIVRSCMRIQVNMDTAQYPNAIRKYKIYPSHLGKVWNDMLTGKIQRRLHYKQLAKETGDPKYASLQEMGKLSLNGGAYGRLNTKGDWQEDPCAMIKVTIG